MYQIHLYSQIAQDDKAGDWLQLQIHPWEGQRGQGCEGQGHDVLRVRREQHGEVTLYTTLYTIIEINFCSSWIYITLLTDWDCTLTLFYPRYISGVGALFTLIMGPYSGAQFVAATMETDFYTTASLSLLVFIASLLMVISSHKRMASRTWFMTGFTWVVTGYVIYLRKDFTEKPAEWLYVASVRINSQRLYDYSIWSNVLFLDSVDRVRCDEYPHPLHRPLDSSPGLI